MTSDAEDLLRKAERLRAQAKRAQADSRGSSPESLESARIHVNDLRDGLRRFVAVMSGIWQTLGYPIASHRWLRSLFLAYASLWSRTVFLERDNGRRILSKTRAVLFVGVTLFLLWLTPSIIKGAVEVAWDTSRMAFSYKTNEVWYLGKSEEIDPVGNIFSAQGCESVNCTDQTSIYFRIKPSLAHHTWSLIHNGNLFFSDFVAAGIQNDVNRCSVTGYGSRWKFLVRNWDIYPQILAVNCSPVTETQIEAAQPATD